MKCILVLLSLSLSLCCTTLVLAEEITPQKCTLEDTKVSLLGVTDSVYKPFYEIKLGTSVIYSTVTTSEDFQRVVGSRTQLDTQNFLKLKNEAFRQVIGVLADLRSSGICLDN